MKVDTLVIGAGRSGTTSLCSFLQSHPGVAFSSIKEVHYFSVAELFARGEKYYHSFFNPKEEQNLLASADTYLMMDYDAVARIQSYNPNMKIIVMLRDPIRRAYSSYHYSVNYGYHEALDTFGDCLHFEDKIEQEPDVVKRNNFGHLYAGLYHRHLSEWQKAFPKENILLLKTTDLKNNPQKLYQQLCSFLGLPYVEIESNGERQNANAIPRNRKLEQFLLNRNNIFRRWIRKGTPEFIKRLIIKSSIVDHMHKLNRVSSQYEPLGMDEYNQLMPYFKEDAEALKRDFGVDIFSDI